MEDRLKSKKEPDNTKRDEKVVLFESEEAKKVNLTVFDLPREFYTQVVDVRNLIKKMALGEEYGIVTKAYYMLDKLVNNFATWETQTYDFYNKVSKSSKMEEK